jgi:hypothetical protein
MKKYIAYFFISIYLFSFTEAREILKLPNLVEHYISHIINNENTSIYSFIKMHYLDDQVLDSDFNQDMKLPFKKVEAVYAANISLPVLFTYHLQIPTFYKEKTLIYSKSQDFKSSFLESIFRPPILG